MELYEVEEKISAVLDKEEKQQCVGQTFYLSELSGEERFEYPNSEVLISLFGIIKNDNSARPFFIQLLKESILESIEYPVVDEQTEYMGYVNVSTLSFYVLVKLGYVDEALDSLRRRFERSSLTYLLIYSILDGDFFKANDLNEILIKLENEHKPPEPIEGRLRRKLLRSLK
jgi:hypothetical protein